MTLPPLSSDMAVFLDFDGTLAEIASHPDDVRVEPDLIASLKRVHDWLDGALAIVTGRPIAQVDAFLSPLRLRSAGLHGLERRPDYGSEIEREAPSAEIRALKGLLRKAPLILEDGVFLEDKGPSLALHYRSVPHMAQAVEDTLREALKVLPALHLVKGKMVIEAKPYTSDKGQVVRWFMDQKEFSGRRPVFIGDDVTDEDGIAAAREQGGFGFKVGLGDTCAQHRLDDVASVHRWLTESDISPETER